MQANRTSAPCKRPLQTGPGQDHRSTYSNAAFIITILIFGFLIDKTPAVPQFLGHLGNEPCNRRAVLKMTKIALAMLALVAALFTVGATPGRAEEPATVTLTLKDHQFEPAEVHAPAGVPIIFRVKNLGPTPSEFESDELHVEKVIAVGGEATVRVRPQQPGRYKFFDDFHRQTEGFLVVP
jgi:plastocyanin